VFALSLPSASFIVQFAVASSHQQAPFVYGSPKANGSDFYIFHNCGEGLSDVVTLIANYRPLQGSCGGPNYFTMDPAVLSGIHIDNDSDVVEGVTFQFGFNNAYGHAGASGLILDDTVISVGQRRANVRVAFLILLQLTLPILNRAKVRL
jgi:hypothetical protein